MKIKEKNKKEEEGVSLNAEVCRMKMIFSFRGGLLVLFLSTMFLLAVLPSVHALIFPQNVDIDLKIPCTLDDVPCSTSASCNLTIVYPNSSYLINNINMTNLGNGDFNATTRFIELGDYPTEVNCNDAGRNATSNFPITITQTGSILSTAQGIVYVIFLIALIFIFHLCLFGAIKLKWRPERGGDGTIIGVNDLKYLKLVLFVASYLLLMFIFGIMRGITANFLFMTGFSGLFNFLFWFMFSFLFPLIILAVVLTIIAYLKDLKIKESIFRNVPLR